MTTKDIDPKIIDAIAHIQASDEGTAYDSNGIQRKKMGQR